MIHGVPVDAWVLSRQDALNTGGMPEEAPSGIRVFLQCMELKRKGPQELAESECRELAHRPLPHPREGKLSEYK